MASRLVLLALLVLVTVALSAPGGPLKPNRRNMLRGRPPGGMKKTPLRDTATSRPAVAATFTQQLDHFDSTNIATFSQRYWYNQQWYTPGGPVFLMLGGEGPEDPYWVESGNLEMTLIAQKVGAWVFDIEHRFYGNTRPTRDMSTANLKYLSSVQAIEDAATFINGMRAKFPQLSNAKWVTFGGSYSGALAAWARAKHPDNVFAAVGSSGPVQAEVDFIEYLEVVKNSITRNSTKCADSVTAGFNQVAQMLNTTAGRQTLKTTFNLCQALDLSNDNNIKTFWETVYSPYMEIVQYSGDQAGLFANTLTISNAICRFHLNDQDTPLQKMFKVNEFFDASQGFFGCNDINYNNFIDFMKDTRYGEAQSDRAWVWQTCTEFGYYQSTGSATAGPWFGGIPNLPAKYYIDQCTAIYGSAYNSDSIKAAIDKTNQYYGGRDNLTTSRIVLPNGDIDPWHALGKLMSNSTDVVPVVINGTAHCADMYGNSPADSQALTDARKKISDTLIGWLSA